MKIIEKMKAKAKDNFNREGVTIAFLGDSVTQGCFELYKKSETEIETVLIKTVHTTNTLQKFLLFCVQMCL